MSWRRVSPCRRNATAITVNAQGQVQATIPGQTAPQQVGQFEITRFPNEGGLNAVGGQSLHRETPSSGSPQSGVPGSIGYGTIQQGFLEGANVNAVEEMTSLITAQRAYEYEFESYHRGRRDAADDFTPCRIVSHESHIPSLFARLLMAYPAFAATGVRIVVPVRDIGRGETIAESDLSYQMIAPENVMVQHPRRRWMRLCGMQTRRVLHQGETVRNDDVRHPILVTKGSTVTMTFDAPGITLTAVGRAMSEGGRRDSVTVLNPHPIARSAPSSPAPVPCVPKTPSPVPGCTRASPTPDHNKKRNRDEFACSQDGFKAWRRRGAGRCSAVERVKEIDGGPKIAPVSVPVAQQLTPLPMPAPLTEPRGASSLWQPGARSFFHDPRASGSAIF